MVHLRGIPLVLMRRTFKRSDRGYQGNLVPTSERSPTPGICRSFLETCSSRVRLVLPVGAAISSFLSAIAADRRFLLQRPGDGGARQVDGPLPTGGTGGAADRVARVARTVAPTGGQDDAVEPAPPRPARRTRPWRPADDGRPDRRRGDRRQRGGGRTSGLDPDGRAGRPGRAVERLRRLAPQADGPLPRRTPPGHAADAAARPDATRHRTPPDTPDRPTPPRTATRPRRSWSSRR